MVRRENHHGSRSFDLDLGASHDFVRKGSCSCKKHYKLLVSNIGSLHKLCGLDISRALAEAGVSVPRVQVIARPPVKHGTQKQDIRRCHRVLSVAPSAAKGPSSRFRQGSGLTMTTSPSCTMNVSAMSSILLKMKRRSASWPVLLR